MNIIDFNGGERGLAMSLDQGQRFAPQSTQEMRAQMKFVHEYIESQRVVLGVSRNQMRRYRQQGQGSYLRKDPITDSWWGDFEIDVKERSGASRLDIMAEPASGKTHALGEAAELNVDPDFQFAVLDATGKLAKVHVIKAATTAHFLHEMRDPKGERLVVNKSHSWNDEEKARNRMAMSLAITRATERLPEEDPAFKHIVVGERVTAFQGDNEVENADITFFQARKTDPVSQDEANMQRDQLANGEDPSKIYRENNGRLDKKLSSEQIENRMGNKLAMEKQLLVVNSRLLTPPWYDRIVDAGVPPYTEADVVNRYSRRRNDEILPVHYTLWMRDRGIQPGRGVVVSNIRVSGETGEPKGYHAHLIETYKLDVSKYVTAQEILSIVG